MINTLCYKSRTTSMLGGVFVYSDGSRCTVPDTWLHDAKITKDYDFIRLTYSSCILEISGHRLESIFNDVVAGKLGTVAVAVPADDDKTAKETTSPYVKSILFLPMTPLEKIELENYNA